MEGASLSSALDSPLSRMHALDAMCIMHDSARDGLSLDSGRRSWGLGIERLHVKQGAGSRSGKDRRQAKV